MSSTNKICADDNLPNVSVLLPVRNEEKFIGRLLTQLLDQDYPPDKVEILLADGMSNDGTREILAAYSRANPRIRWMDNAEKIVATGLNRLIKAARGEILMRIDGHAAVERDYIRTSVTLLLGHPEAWGVGGPIVHVGQNVFGRSVAAAMSNPLAMGFASHRLAEFEGYGEGAAFWSFHRWVFDRVGGFDEKLVRTEDDEFNFRVTQAGGKIFLSPRIRSIYYVRDSVPKVAVQFFQYSFWRIPVIKKHRRPTTIRQTIPLLFYLVMTVLFVIGLFRESPLVALFLPVLYLLVLFTVAAMSVRQVGVRSATLMPIAIIVMHAAYAWGMLSGLWASLFRRSWFDIDGKMTQLSR